MNPKPAIQDAARAQKNMATKRTAFRRAGTTTEGSIYQRLGEGSGAIPAQSYPQIPQTSHLLGNVLDWVEDWYHGDYYQRLPSPALDPPVPVSGEFRVGRGGAWVDDPRNLRVSFRARFAPPNRGNLVGFRCAREVVA